MRVHVSGTGHREGDVRDRCMCGQLQRTLLRVHASSVFSNRLLQEACRDAALADDGEKRGTLDCVDVGRVKFMLWVCMHTALSRRKARGDEPNIWCVRRPLQIRVADEGCGAAIAEKTTAQCSIKGSSTRHPLAASHVEGALR
eukprot:scaffold7059_cov250-Pinguiococcus_pyrenoidosus.AAC.17